MKIGKMFAVALFNIALSALLPLIIIGSTLENTQEADIEMFELNDTSKIIINVQSIKPNK
jgi:hypothetical protein